MKLQAMLWSTAFGLTVEGIDENGKSIDVPAVLVTCEYIDANNMNKVWESGYHTEDEIKGGN